MVKELKIPFYIKATISSVGIIALLAVLYIAQDIIVPLVFATIIAILLTPVVSFFVRLKIGRVLSIIITLLLTFVIVAAFGTLLVSQAIQFGESWPTLVEKFTEVVNQAIIWISGSLNIDSQNIDDWITKTKEELINTSGVALGQTLLAMGNLLVVIFIMPVYIFLILFYQPLLTEFINKLFGKDNKNQVKEISTQIKIVVQKYLSGLIIEILLIASMEIATLFILGIDYAILLGIIGALFNLIPYIGGLVAGALPMMVALATKDTGWYAIYVLIIYYIIQLIDNNYIVPKIVASKVKINALFSMIVVIVGNAFWGIPGMFLSIPLLAIVKLVFDHIESLKPWGFLLGDTMPSLLKIKPIFKNLKTKRVTPS